MRASRIVPLVLLLGAVAILPGCWNSRELKDLAIVLAMGVDRVPESGKFKVSFQIIDPGTVAAGRAGGGGEGLGVPVTVYSGTGSTLFEAIRQTSEKVPRQLFFSQIRLILIGEPFAREGVSNLFDFFERSHEVRLTTSLLVARDNDAETVLKVMAPLEKIPADAMFGKLRTASKVWSESLDMQVDAVVNSLVGPGKQLILSGVRLKGDPSLGERKANVEHVAPPALFDIEGIGLFRNGKLETWLEGEAARGVLWVDNKVEGTVMTIPCQNKKAATSIEIMRSRTKVRADIRNGDPVFQVTVKSEGNINEVLCPIDLSKKETMVRMERELSRQIEREVREAVQVAQSHASDIFGFGDALNRSRPKAWRKMKNSWSRTFAECRVEVKAESYIRRSGMRIKPYTKAEKQR